MNALPTRSLVMALVAMLFGTHARSGVTVLVDIYCDLSDTEDASIRAPDVVLVGDLASPKNAVYTGTPILAVEIRGTQSTMGAPLGAAPSSAPKPPSKRYLEEKVKLYLE